MGSTSSVDQAHQSNAKHRYLDRSPRRAYPFMGHICVVRPTATRQIVRFLTKLIDTRTMGDVGSNPEEHSSEANSWRANIVQQPQLTKSSELIAEALGIVKAELF